MVMPGDTVKLKIKLIAPVAIGRKTEICYS